VNGNDFDYNGMLTWGLLLNGDADCYKVCQLLVLTNANDLLSKSDCRYLSPSFNCSYNIIFIDTKCSRLS